MNAIVVVDSRWAIGCEGRLLFSLPTDMKRFRSLTLNGTVILGRKTLDTFPGWKVHGESHSYLEEYDQWPDTFAGLRKKTE